MPMAVGMANVKKPESGAKVLKMATSRNGTVNML
jgi:hypothetical protein